MKFFQASIVISASVFSTVANSAFAFSIPTSNRGRSTPFGSSKKNYASEKQSNLCLSLHQNPEDGVNPRSKGKTTFLGIRHESGFLRNSKKQQNQVTQQSQVTSLMPDGGLSPCVIKVCGVGGGGTNAVDRMLDTGIYGGVEFWAINTDAQALGRSKAKGAQILNIGTDVTRGLGAGGDPEVGRLAAEESRDEIAALVAGTDLCFVTSGMGGGTGTGAAPIVSEIAKESGALTIAIVTKPFAFEGRRRMRQAQEGIDRLKENVDAVIVISNNKLLDIVPDNTPLETSFRIADDILRQGVAGISEIITRPGLVNVDFADVRSVMKNAGTALMGIGKGSGKHSAEDAAFAAISSPLIESSVKQATGAVMNIIGGSDLSLPEADRASMVIHDFVHPEANLICGILIDDEITDGSVSVTVLVTGFDEDTPSDSTSSSESVPDYFNK